MFDASSTWQFLPIGYCLTILIEAPVLLVALSPIHKLRDRLIAGLWLTACTYPIVVLVMPPLVWEPLGRTWYLVVAEIFAPVAECLLFRWAYHVSGHHYRRDYAVIILANLASFITGEMLFAL